MTLAIKIPEELEVRLNALAKKLKRSKSFLAREAMETYIEDQEDYLLAVTADMESRGKPTYSSEEARKLCGLDD